MKPPKPTPTPTTKQPANIPPPSMVARHLRLGWWSLLIFLSLGIVLEGLHGFKVGAYLNVSNHTRRLMWTLAHAHGALFGLVHVAFAATLPHLQSLKAGTINQASAGLTASAILIPGGFFLGGCVIYGGDPGLGILLVPLGAVFLLSSVFIVAKNIRAE